LIYQVTLLTKKLGNKAETIADEIKLDFLQRYFGTNKKIHEIALMAILNNELKLAKELNKKISLLGDAASEKIYIDLKPKIIEIIAKKKEKQKQKSQESQKNYQKKNKYSEQNNKKNNSAKYFLIFVILGFLVFIGSIIFSNSSSKVGGCISHPENCSDSHLCELATYTEGGLRFWSKKSASFKNHVIFAKSKNLNCLNK